MKSKYLILFVLLIVTVACTKDYDPTPMDLTGDYVGTFERNGVTSQVELAFTNGTYEGQSDTTKFPAICSGTYVISGNTINLENACPWTAEFDWSLILSGEWNFRLIDDRLTMTNHLGDTYVLTKE